MVPVSPKTFYDYLRAIAIGFRGLKIAQETRRIEQLLLGPYSAVGPRENYRIK
jgi:DNA anti-recombination protein RmuC